jgi:hypothetical protein
MFMSVPSCLGHNVGQIHRRYISYCLRPGRRMWHVAGINGLRARQSAHSVQGFAGDVFHGPCLGGAHNTDPVLHRYPAIDRPLHLGRHRTPT